LFFSSVPYDNRDETEGEILLSQLGKSLSNDKPHHIHSDQQSSLSDSLIRNNMPSSSMPKLLLKRASIKQPSFTAQSTKLNATSSITDVSASSSNTITTDHFPSTHSTISDQEEIISLKKSNKGSNTKNRFTATSDSVSKYNILKKTPQPSEIYKQQFIHRF
jgi:hypothetical protein